MFHLRLDTTLLVAKVDTGIPLEVIPVTEETSKAGAYALPAEVPVVGAGIVGVVSDEAVEGATTVPVSPSPRTLGAGVGGGKTGAAAEVLGVEAKGMLSMTAVCPEGASAKVLVGGEGETGVGVPGAVAVASGVEAKGMLLMTAACPEGALAKVLVGGAGKTGVGVPNLESSATWMLVSIIPLL